jgi:hypothetical protein
MPALIFMSVEPLDLLHEKLPELFAVKELPENWDDDLIIVSVPDVELIGEAADAMFNPLFSAKK